MKKATIIKGAGLFVILATSCNKGHVVPQNADNKRIVISQKDCNVSLDKAIITITTLSDFGSQNNALSKTLLPATDVAADSSIWALEAALNYHFDKDPQSHDIYIDSLTFSTPVNTIDGINYIVTATDLNNAYNQFKAGITQKSAGPQKVKVVDITAFIDPAQNRIIYNASIIFAVKTLPTNCLPFTNGAAWSAGCVLPDGSAQDENRLNNCERFECPNLFYSNITNTIIGNINGTYASSLYYLATSFTSCESITATNLNNYYNGSKNLAVANLPSSPNVIPINYDIQPGIIFTGPGPFQSKKFWNLSITYAKTNCNSADPN